MLSNRIDAGNLHFDQVDAIAKQGNFKTLIEPWKEFQSWVNEVWVVRADWLNKPENERALVDFLKAQLMAFRKANSDFDWYLDRYRKYASLKAEDDPYTITFERACEVVAAKKIADANRIIQDFGIDDIQVLNGRYGPYITDKQRNARIPKERDPKTLTLEECRALLEAAPQRPGRGRFGKAKGSAAKGSTTKGKTAKAKTAEPAAGDAATEAPKKKSAANKDRKSTRLNSSHRT